TRPVERTEERAEEHHFRKDEPAHPPAEGNVHALVVHAAFGFVNHVPEPAEHHGDQPEEPDEQHPAADADAVEPDRRTECHGEQRHRTDDRPVRRLRYEVLRSVAQDHVPSRLFFIPFVAVRRTPKIPCKPILAFTALNLSSPPCRPPRRTCRTT